jgi:hypothetical protein
MSFLILTYEEWLAAAGIDEDVKKSAIAGSSSTCGTDFYQAWKRGEDPSDWRKEMSDLATFRISTEPTLDVISHLRDAGCKVAAGVNCIFVEFKRRVPNAQVAWRLFLENVYASKIPPRLRGAVVVEISDKIWT